MGISTLKKLFIPVFLISLLFIISLIVVSDYTNNVEAKPHPKVNIISDLPTYEIMPKETIKIHDIRISKYSRERLWEYYDKVEKIKRKVREEKEEPEEVIIKEEDC